jgi:hypothetical protein
MSTNGCADRGSTLARHVVAISMAGVACGVGCGTYSLVRPAETMPKGRMELAAGLAASSVGEANTILHAAYAITDNVEVLAQNEVWNSFVEARYGLLHEASDGLSLALGVGGGRAITLVSALGDSLDPSNAESGAAGLISASVGKRLGTLDLTIGNRTFVQAGSFFMSSTRAAVRVSLGGHFGLMLEGGGTVHAPIESPELSLFIAEASAGFFLGW